MNCRENDNGKVVFGPPFLLHYAVLRGLDHLIVASESYFSFADVW